MRHHKESNQSKASPALWTINQDLHLSNTLDFLKLPNELLGLNELSIFQVLFRVIQRGAPPPYFIDFDQHFLLIYCLLFFYLHLWKQAHNASTHSLLKLLNTEQTKVHSHRFLNF